MAEGVKSIFYAPLGVLIDAPARCCSAMPRGPRSKAQTPLVNRSHRLRCEREFGETCCGLWGKNRKGKKPKLSNNLNIAMGGIPSNPVTLAPQPWGRTGPQEISPRCCPCFLGLFWHGGATELGASPEPQRLLNPAPGGSSLGSWGGSARAQLAALSFFPHPLV